MKGHGSKGSTAASSLAYPDHSLKYTPAPSGGQQKNKLNLFDVTNMLKQNPAGSRSPEAFNGLANGSLFLPAEAPSTSTSSALHRKDFPKNISDFSLYQKRHRGGNLGHTPSKIYSVSEEVDELDPEQPGHGRKQAEHSGPVAGKELLGKVSRYHDGKEGECNQEEDECEKSEDEEEEKGEEDLGAEELMEHRFPQKQVREDNDDSSLSTET